MEGQSQFVVRRPDHARAGWKAAQGGLPGPAAWPQLAVLPAARIPAMPISRRREPMLVGAVTAHSCTLPKPRPPECELRAHGDSGMEFAGEFAGRPWGNGPGAGKNNRASDVLLPGRNAREAQGIEIPYPQRLAHHGGLPPGPTPRT